MKIKQVNYFGFDHNEVDKKFGGELTYIGDFCLNDTYQPVAVYKKNKPDRSKGHKRYMTLSKQYVGGMELEDLLKHTKHSAAHCLECDTVLYSVHRHHFHECNCNNEMFVDGGRDYLRIGAKDLSKVVTGILDVLNDEFILEIKDEI